MLDSLLIRHGAPTLAGLKTGTLFPVSFPSPQDMRSCLLYRNRHLLPKGLRLLPLGTRRDRTLLYLYRMSALSRDLHHPAVGALLTEFGYPCPHPEHCLLHLRRQLTATQSFPHEIGLFLGYPPEDVRGFLRDPSASLCSGYWKVYGDPDAAQLLFARFRACSYIYAKQLAQGIPPEHLAISG